MKFHGGGGAKSAPRRSPRADELGWRRLGAKLGTTKCREPQSIQGVVKTQSAATAVPRTRCSKIVEPLWIDACSGSMEWGSMQCLGGPRPGMMEEESSLSTKNNLTHKEAAAAPVRAHCVVSRAVAPA